MQIECTALPASRGRSPKIAEGLWGYKVTEENRCPLHVGTYITFEWT